MRRMAVAETVAHLQLLRDNGQLTVEQRDAVDIWQRADLAAAPDELATTAGGDELAGA